MTIESLSLAVLLLASTMFLYHHLGYPLLLSWLANRLRPEIAHPSDEHVVQRVAVFVPAYREAHHIAGLISALGAQHCPALDVECHILCDGSPDNTPDVARSAVSSLAPGHIRITTHEFIANRGKVAVLNEAIAGSDAEIIVLLDASSRIAPDFLTRITAPFADPAIGVVAPAYDPGCDGSEAEQSYWRYQRRIKAAEAILAAPIGVHGAGYAFRRSFAAQMPAETINDDFVLPMQIVAAGHKAVHLNDLVVEDADIASSVNDLRRRRRLGAGNFQQVLMCHRLGWACGARIAFLFLSGKALRAVMPLVLMLAYLASGLLAVVAEHPLAIVPFAAQSLAYGLAFASLHWPRLQKTRAITALSYLLTSYAMMGIGMVDLILGRYRDERRVVPAQGGANSQGPRLDEPNKATLVCKRALDIAIAVIVSLVFIALLPFLALAIRLDSRGPVFYRQLRVGRALHDRTELFYLIKLRTMRVDAEAKSGAVWASQHDPRVTRLGRFMRKTRLDELPQCFNVLRGDMSIVGPRPERPVFFNRLETAIPFYIERTYGLKPGVTGLAQVSTGYDASVDDVRLKILFDHSYALHIRSPLQWLRTDLSIIVRTFLVMGLGLGR